MVNQFSNLVNDGRGMLRRYFHTSAIYADGRMSTKHSCMHYLGITMSPTDPEILHSGLAFYFAGDQSTTRKRLRFLPSSLIAVAQFDQIIRSDIGTPQGNLEDARRTTRAMAWIGRGITWGFVCRVCL